MKNLVTTLRQKTRTLRYLPLSLAMLLQNTAYAAGLPTLEAPSKGEGKGIIETIKFYAADGVTLFVLALCALAFIRVALAGLETFGEVRAKKATWGELGGIILVGVILLVLIIWLGNKATEIF